MKRNPLQVNNKSFLLRCPLASTKATESQGRPARLQSAPLASTKATESQGKPQDYSQPRAAQGCAQPRDAARLLSAEGRPRLRSARGRRKATLSPLASTKATESQGRPQSYNKSVRLRCPLAGRKAARFSVSGRPKAALSLDAEDYSRAGYRLDFSRLPLLGPSLPVYKPCGFEACICNLQASIDCLAVFLAHLQA